VSPESPRRAQRLVALLVLALALVALVLWLAGRDGRPGAAPAAVAAATAGAAPASSQAGYWVREFRRRWRLELRRRHAREATIRRLRHTVTLHAHTDLIPGVWLALAWCESRQRWTHNGSSGFDGGLQFHPDTWSRYRRRFEPPYAYQASPLLQVSVARRVLAAEGWHAWPTCARKLGLR
jgi:Transglycosylase-like domain